MKSVILTRDVEITLDSLIGDLTFNLPEDEIFEFILELEVGVGDWDFTMALAEALLERVLTEEEHVRSYVMEDKKHPNLAKFLLLRELDKEE